MPGQDLGTPDYHMVATAFGGYGERVERAEDIAPALSRAIASRLPAILNVIVDPYFASATHLGFAGVMSASYGEGEKARRDKGNLRESSELLRPHGPCRSDCDPTGPCLRAGFGRCHGAGHAAHDRAGRGGDRAGHRRRARARPDQCRYPNRCPSPGGEPRAPLSRPSPNSLQ